MDMAKQLILESKKVGADCVKFQKRKKEAILTKAALAAPYNSKNAYGATYGEHRDALEFNEEQWIELKKYADEVGIDFIGSGWDESSVDFLDRVGCPFFKVASADLTTFPLLRHIASKGKPMVISTGMADAATVRECHDFVASLGVPFIMLHCCSAYPCKDSLLNLNCIKTFTEEYPNTVIGYSGHEVGVATTLAAVALGAHLVERHFTMDKTLKGGDHKASLEPQEMSTLITQMRSIQAALGDGIKVMAEEEKPVFKKLGKSLVSVGCLKAGTVLTKANLTWKSPGHGILVSRIDEVLGKTLNRDIDDDVVIPADAVDM